MRKVQDDKMRGRRGESRGKEGEAACTSTEQSRDRRTAGTCNLEPQRCDPLASASPSHHARLENKPFKKECPPKLPVVTPIRGIRIEEAVAEEQQPVHASKHYKCHPLIWEVSNLKGRMKDRWTDNGFVNRGSRMRPINPDSLPTSEWRLPIRRGPAGDQHQNPEPRHKPPAVNAQTEDSASPGPSRLGDPKSTGVPLQALAERGAMAGPDRAERGRAGQSQAEPSRAGPNRAGKNRAKPSRAERSPAKPKANSRQAEPAASVAQTPSWRESCPSRSQQFLRPYLGTSRP